MEHSLEQVFSSYHFCNGENILHHSFCNWMRIASFSSRGYAWERSGTTLSLTYAPAEEISLHAFTARPIANIQSCAPCTQ